MRLDFVGCILHVPSDWSGKVLLPATRQANFDFILHELLKRTLSSIHGYTFFVRGLETHRKWDRSSSCELVTVRNAESFFAYVENAAETRFCREIFEVEQRRSVTCCYLLLSTVGGKQRGTPE